MTIDRPVDIPAGRHRVVLMVDEQTTAEPTDELGWPPGFIERTYGSLVDLNLVREPQGDYEEREAIE